MNMWEAFGARAAFAERWGLSHFLWVGLVDDGAPAEGCSSDDAKLVLMHVTKTMAALRAFLLETCAPGLGPCDAALYADLDTVPA